MNALGAFSFQPHNLQPTRITNHSATLIDNIFSNSFDQHVIAGNVVYDISDHLPNFLTLRNSFSAATIQPNVFVRDYSKLDEVTLHNEIKAIDWREILSECHDPNSLFGTFHSTISQIIDKHIPLKKLSRKQQK